MCSSSVWVFFLHNNMIYAENLSLESLFYINEKGLVCQEEWRDVPNYEGYYQASNLGRIRSIKRTILTKKGFRKIKGFIINPYVNKKNRYYSFSVSVCNVKKTINVHSFVYYAFNRLASVKKGYFVIDHIDNNPLNNKIENLQLVTNRINGSKDRINGTSKYVGVYWRKDRSIWQSQISINKKVIKILTHKNEELCLKAYQEALLNIDLYNGDNVEFRKLVKSKLFLK